jgi:hypothetical protein
VATRLGGMLRAVGQAAGRARLLAPPSRTMASLVPFDFEDPMRIRELLTEEETMVMVSAA